MKLFRLLCAALLAGVTALSASAQCLVPDGLNFGAPCNAAQAAVRAPGFVHPAMAICYQDCNVSSTSNFVARWSATFPFYGPSTAPSCAWFQVGLQLFQGTNLRWIGRFHMSYSRTWTESKAPGQQYQVWRYLINGDMRRAAGGTLPCGVPSCVAAFGGNMRVTGYIDYARDCATGAYEEAWVLVHGCDSIDHAPGFPRAGSFHPNRTYAFVGPSWGFVPGAGGTLESGALSNEGVRRWMAPALPARCTVEEPLTIGSIAPTGAACPCGSGPGVWHEASLAVAAGAGTTVSPFPGSAPFRSFPVGQWTLPMMFPGVEEVRWNCNEAQWVECSGLTRNEFFFGVTTTGGFNAATFNPGTIPAPLPPSFLDQSNSALLPGGAMLRNVPYRSDHILNLNF